LNEQLALRPAGPGDLPFILATERRPGFDVLVARSSEEEHVARLARPDARYLIARAGGLPVGFALLEGLDDRHHGVKLRRIAVSEPGQGHGVPFMRALIAWVFTETAAERLWLDVFVHNPRARHVYRKVGFREDGLLRQAYVLPDGRRVDRALMSILRSEWQRPS
jgi:diamine N-acetyltransferase